MEFSTLEAAVWTPYTHAAIEQKLPSLELKTQAKQLLGYILLYMALPAETFQLVKIRFWMFDDEDVSSVTKTTTHSYSIW